MCLFGPVRYIKLDVSKHNSGNTSIFYLEKQYLFYCLLHLSPPEVINR